MPVVYPATPARKRLYTRLRVGDAWAERRWPDWRGDDYRMVLSNFGAQKVRGVYSATTMTDQQLKNVMSYFTKRGFRLQPKKSTDKTAVSDWRKPRIAKLNAMWCQLADAGHVDDRSETAMEAWCKNNVPGVTRLQWADNGQLNKSVQMLKQFCIRCDVTVY